MDILWRAAPDLARWERAAMIDPTRRPRDHADAYVREVGIEAVGAPGATCARLLAAVRNYDIFPPTLVRGVLRRPVEVGDTVGIHYVRLPLVRLFFAARVIATFDGAAPGEPACGASGARQPRRAGPPRDDR